MTPITIGRGHLELLQREPGAGPAEVSETCDVVLGELGRMERVINRLLLLESADATAPKTFERVEADEVVTEVFQRWRGTADREWILGDVPRGTVAADRDQLMLALDALVENAIQHTRRASRSRWAAIATRARCASASATAETGSPRPPSPRVRPLLPGGRRP